MNEVAHAGSGPQQPKPHAFFFDLAIYLSVMFLIRNVYVPELGFLANGLFWSLTTLAVAAWRMRARRVTWAELGLCMPPSFARAFVATLAVFGLAVGFVIVFNLIGDQLFPNLAPDQSEEAAVSKFGELSGNWALFFAIIPFIWLQSALEEILDRGFLINWIERALSSGWIATIIAVLAQAVIFGFRHSYDLSERSITVGLIGLAMGIVYVLSGRNLWPLIVAHCILNTMSMLGRVS